MSAATRPFDDTAAQRLRQRLHHAPAAPWLHAEAARRMAERLGVFRQPPQRVVDWSGAAGGPPEVLRAACPQAQIDRIGAARGNWWQRLRGAGEPLVAEAVADGAYDLAWSVMALHWAADPPALLRRWQRALAVEGALLFATLGPGTLAELRTLYQAAGWGSPMAALVDMHDLGDMLVEAGYSGPVMDQETLTLTWPTPEAALAELRTLGVNADPARHTGLRTPRWRNRLLAALRERAGPDGRIAFSFELVYGHAIRSAERGPQMTPETRIELGQMSAMLRRR